MPDTADAEAKGIDVWSPAFVALCRSHGLLLRERAPEEAEISEAFAAHFIIAVLRGSHWCRWRYPNALSGGADGGFARWLLARGANRFGLSAAALKKIRGVFRRDLAARVKEIYLQDRELQRLYPLGLAPAGQRQFLAWLTTHGRTDQNLEDHEILWFLHESPETVGRAVALSYALNPQWQEEFPGGITANGWQDFRRSLASRYPALVRWRRQLREAPRPPDSATTVTPARESGGGEQALRLSGVNILSHFCYPSGIRQAALWTKAALERVELRTSCRDVPAGINTRLEPRARWLGLETYPVTIINVAPTPYFASAYERSGCYRRPDVYRIAYWAWELEAIPEEWLQLRPLLDEIWAPTEFVAAAMRTRFDMPVHRVLPGLEMGQPKPMDKAVLGVPEDHFVFLFMFDMYSDFERKNPLGVIRAFRRAFRRAEKATLIVKTTADHPDPVAAERLTRAAEENEFTLVRQTLSRAETDAYLAMCDCYVSLHRSEGFGLGMAEAMLLGKPVIATRYSGNMDFMHAGNSLLVEYERVPVRNAGPLYTIDSVWAEPSEEHAASLMRQVFDGREAAAQLGLEAQRELRELLSLDAAGARMLARLHAVEASRP